MSSIRRSLINAKVKDSPNYLCFTAIEDGTFTLTLGSLCNTNCISYIEYSTDNGSTWVKTNNVNSTEVVVTTPTIPAGNEVYWRGSGVRNGIVSANNLNYFGIFSSTGKFDVSGNIGSYLFGEDYDSSAYDNRSFISLFRNCVNLVNAKDLILPSNFTNDNTGYIYDCLFRDCTSLISTPSLSHITTLKPYIYEYMFYGCTSLATAPELPATTLTTGCYRGMFEDCSTLINAPELPATALTNACYNMMFRKCTSLITAPTLRIISIDQISCANMFDGCSNLENVSIKITATTIYKQCLYSMLWGCTKLMPTVELNTLILAEQCYYGLFYYTKVNYIKMLATDISAANCLANWVAGGVPNVSTSIFVKHIDATWTTTGNSGVPTNWTVIYYDPALNKYYTDQTRSQECDDHGNPILN